VCVGEGGGERAMERMSKTKESLALLSIIGLCAAISVLAQPTPTTPFVIYGYVFYEDGSECKNPMINITNLNSGAEWQAETNECSNYYQLVLVNGTGVNASEMLQFEVKNHDESQLNITSHKVTLEEINNGGIFNFNITLEAPEAPTALTFDTGKPANPYPSISGTHNGTITPYVTIYNVSKLYTYPCPGTGGHTEYVAFYHDPNRTEKITEGHWNGYASDWHNVSFSPFTMLANHTYYYTIKTGSYPQIHHAPVVEAKGGMGIINCTSFVDANGRSYTNWIPAIRLVGYSVNKTFGVKETEWPMFHHDLNHTGCTPATGNASVKDYGLLWSYTTDDKVLSSPVIADLDRDGYMETIVGSYDGKLYVFNSTGALKWNLTAGGAIHSTPAIDDIDKDAELEIVVGSMGGNLYAIDADGKVKWNNTSESWIWMKSSPAIADIDKDGSMEIVACSYGYDDSSPAIHVLNYMGEEKWQHSIDVYGGWSESSPAVADMDKDGGMEIIVGATMGLHVINTAGQEEWNHSWMYGIYSSPTIGDIDNDGEMEIVVGFDSLAECYINDDQLLIFNSTGHLEWNFTAGFSVSSSPAIADIDGDGEIELIFGASVVGCDSCNTTICNLTRCNPIGCNMTDCHTLYGVLFVLNSTGQVEWIYETTGSIDSSPAIADLDGEGDMEIIVGSNDGKLYIFNSTGQVEWSYQAGGAVYSSPAIADINNDGNLEIIVGSEDGKIYAFGTH